MKTSLRTHFARLLDDELDVDGKNELSMYHNPKTGHTVAKWVDDLITRGPKAAQLEYWENLGKRFDIKSWGIVAVNKPRVFCNKEISMEIKDGIKWYYITQDHH